MSFRRAMCAVALCGVAPAAASAQSRLVEGGYEITYLGFAGFRIDFTARFDGNRYDIESHAYKEGVMRAVTLRYEGRNRAWGRFSLRDGAQPSGGSLSIIVDDKSRTWLALYGPGGQLSETHNPPWKPPQPKDEMSEADKIGTLDPLTATLMVVMKGDDACRQTAPSNDGERRIDVTLRQVGTESPQGAGVPEAKGNILVCEIYSKRVAGYFDAPPEEAESKKERPMKIWMAHLDDTPFRFPVKLEASPGFGTAHGHLLYFRERPLTEEEKVAMQR
ncbi:MAG TPA: DUF3108 domain-containing protein [Reyranella sp.]|nr:DUF3108 domain-containing protein [Reyranella sp.]